MTITYFSGNIHHHQIGVADELFSLTQGNFRFVCTKPVSCVHIKNGYYDFSTREYAVRAYEKAGAEEALRLAEKSDVAILGGNENVQIYRDIRLSKDILTFECGERWLKKGLVNLFSPRLLKFQFRYHTRYRKANNYYALLTSAFAKNDYILMRTFIDRCFKWAYFTKVGDMDISNKTFFGNRIMWCNRFIDWKHPEIPVLLAKSLKDQGYVFTLDMFGSGCLEDKIFSLIKKLEVEDCVKLRGTAPNDIIRNEMYNHDILITTSDRNEGWGTTVNEGMACGCVVVGANEVGSVPYLIKDGENGLVFKSKDMDDLAYKIKTVINNPSKCRDIALNAYCTMKDIWNPKNGAQRLYSLCDSLLNDYKLKFDDGPCSKA